MPTLEADRGRVRLTDPLLFRFIKLQDALGEHLVQPGPARHSGRSAAETRDSSGFPLFRLCVKIAGHKNRVSSMRLTKDAASSIRHIVNQACADTEAWIEKLSALTGRELKPGRRGPKRKDMRDSRVYLVNCHRN